MDTTIQISSELLERLRTMKIYSKESYESIIWDLVEDRLEFSDSTKRNIEQSKKDIKKEKTISLKELKKKIGV